MFKSFVIASSFEAYVYMYHIISNIGAAPIKAPPRTYPTFSCSNCMHPWALELILGGTKIIGAE